MKKVIFIIALLYCYAANAQQKQHSEKIPNIVKTAAEWKAVLTEKQYYILREAGTEKAFTSPLNNSKAKGIYTCAACKTPLYSSIHKYDSGSGWPSFDKEIQGNVTFDVDYKIGYARTELKCATCHGHLGHSFKDGPKETTGVRHCINGAALFFVPKQ